RLGDLLGHRKVDRGVVYDLAFLPGRFDQRRRDRFGRWRGGEHARGERRATKRGGTLQQLASGQIGHRCLPQAFFVRPAYSSVLYPTSTRHRCGGNVSQTLSPCGTLCSADVTTRSCVPSASSTI